MRVTTGRHTFHLQSAAFSYAEIQMPFRPWDILSLLSSTSFTPIGCVCCLYRSCSMTPRLPWFSAGSAPGAPLWREPSFLAALSDRFNIHDDLLSWPPEVQCEVPHVPLKDGHRQPQHQSSIEWMGLRCDTTSGGAKCRGVHAAPHPCPRKKLLTDTLVQRFPSSGGRFGVFGSQ